VEAAGRDLLRQAARASRIPKRSQTESGVLDRDAGAGAGRGRAEHLRPARADAEMRRLQLRHLASMLLLPSVAHYVRTPASYSYAQLTARLFRSSLLSM
jgi:hypothetical protein